MKRFICALIGIVLFSASSFARPLSPIQPDDLQRRLQRLQHQPLTIRPAERQVDSSSTCTEYEIALPVIQEGQTRNQTVYLTIPRGKKGKLPVVVLVPSMLGAQLTEYSAAETLCDAGLAALVTDFFDNTQPNDPLDWSIHDRRLIAAVHSLKTAVDFVQMHPKLDGQKVGVMGLSMGAILSAVLAGSDARLKAVVIAGGAGNLPAVMAHSDESSVSELRERRMETLDLKDSDAYEDLLRTHIQIDPFYFASRVNPASVLMFRIKGDTKVPEENQSELWESLGRPQFQELDDTHVMSLIYLTLWGMDPVVEFFKARLR